MANTAEMACDDGGWLSATDPTVMERLWPKNDGFFKTHLGEPK